MVISISLLISHTFSLSCLLAPLSLTHTQSLSQVEFVYYLQEWAARSTVSTKKLLEAFCYEYSASKAACRYTFSTHTHTHSLSLFLSLFLFSDLFVIFNRRFITVDGGKDTISLKQFLAEPASPADKNTVRY